MNYGLESLDNQQKELGNCNPSMIAPRPQSKLVYFHLRHKVLHDIHLAKGIAFSRDVLLSKHKREKHFELPTGVHMCENLRQNSNRKFKRKALINWARDIFYFQTIKSTTFSPYTSNYLIDLSTKDRPNLNKWPQP